MELKSYQKNVIRDLSGYFGYLQQYKKADKAFDNYWKEKVGSYNPISGEGMRPYQSNVPDAVHLCIKVPTAGGKTFIACNAIKTIFDALPENKTKAVVWLVPWSNLLDQTVKNLSDPDHPYCQKLNSLFNNRICVYEKKDLLHGTSFNPSIVKEQLSIMVMNFASIRAKNKDDRKIFEQNGALSAFSLTNANNSHLLEGSDETSLINIIRNLNPVLIVDESHNAESDLSVDMLRNLNPSFILDLTATPKDNANIISLVPAIELKKEHMVKLPVIVYNQQDKEGVVESSLHLQQKLEVLAIAQEKEGGKYIRPIVLFQAQSKTREDNTTFEKLKEQLIKIGIPEEQIKIKTANKDELKGINLMDRSCPVRYVITINALKEGWDCPFAYILASLADKSSEIDVTQILGRVLRQPYVMKHSDPMLNLSYVITASLKFNETLQNIIKGLKESGFSEKDYREHNAMLEPEKNSIPPQKAEISNEIIFNSERISFRSGESIPDSSSVMKEIEEMAIVQNAEMEKQIAESNNNLSYQIFSEVGIKVKQYSMRQDVAELAKSIVLPKFVQQTRNLDIFHTEEDGLELLDRAILLEGFKLVEKDIDINFDGISSDLYRIDLEHTTSDDYKMSPFKIENSPVQEQLIDYILAKPRESQIKDISHQVIQNIGKIYPIPDQHIKKYVNRILDNMNADQLKDFIQRKLTYTNKIKQKITALSDTHAEKQFMELKEVGIISTKPCWKFPGSIVPNAISGDIGNSLYTHEGEMNNLEQEFIMKIAGCSNIAFWHRNLGRGKGFSLNGFKSDHYPDFIIVTKKKTIILAETKGSDRDNSDSVEKLQLGKAWSELSGSNYKYLMIFEKNAPEGAYNIDKAKELIMKM
jgi:type III restriction enzyme